MSRFLGRLVPKGGESGVSEQRDLVQLLNAAHATLPSEDLAALLLAVRAMIAPPERLVADGGLSRSRERLSPSARRPLGAIIPALAQASSRSDGSEWLDEYLDELAARPRGSAIDG